MARPKLTHMPHQVAAREAAEQARRGPGPGEIPACDACGEVGRGFFGFGVFSKRPGSGAYACADPDCRAAVEAAVYDQEEAA